MLPHPRSTSIPKAEAPSSTSYILLSSRFEAISRPKFFFRPSAISVSPLLHEVRGMVLDVWRCFKAVVGRTAKFSTLPHALAGPDAFPRRGSFASLKKEGGSIDSIASIALSEVIEDCFMLIFHELWAASGPKAFPLAGVMAARSPNLPAMSFS